MKNLLTILFLFICLAANAQLIKFSELPSASTLGGTEIVPGVQSGDNRKISLNQIKTFNWDLSPTIATSDTIGFVIVRRTSDGKIFKRSISSIVAAADFLPLSLTENTTIVGNGFSLDLSNLSSLDFQGTGILEFQTSHTSTTDGVIIAAPNGRISFESDYFDIEADNDAILNAANLEVIGQNLLTLQANDDLNLDILDDLQINGVAGTTNQVITNTNGKAAWGNLGTIGSGAFWPLTGTAALTGTTTITGGGTIDLVLGSAASKLDQFDVDADNVITIEAGNGSTTIGDLFLGNGDAFLSATDDIDLSATDDLLINGVAGTTGQVIGNVNGHPQWETPTGGSAHTIEDEGTPLADQDELNFVGTGVTVTDTGGKTVVTIPGSGDPSYVFNVMDYGAVGDCSTDDGPAIQAAFDAAAAINPDGHKGIVIIPPPTGDCYAVATTIEVLPVGGGFNQVWADVKGYGIPGLIRYSGSNNTACFYIEGLKGSRWEGVNVSIVTGRSGCVAFDIDTDADANSSSHVTFANTYIQLGGDDDGGSATARNEDCIGIRTGLVSGGNGDISNYNFENVQVFGGGDSGDASANSLCLGQYAFQNLGSNVLSMIWYGGFVAQCDRAYSNTNRAGSTRGNGSVAFYGLGGSGNNVDFVFAWEQTYLITGGRWESGNQFLRVVDGAFASVKVDHLVIHAYKDDNDIIDIERASSLHLDGVHIIKSGGGSYTSVIDLNADHGVREGSLVVENCLISLASTVPFPFIQSGQVRWKVRCTNNMRNDAAAEMWSDSYFYETDKLIDTSTSQVGNVTSGEDDLYSLTILASTLKFDGNSITGRISGTVASNANVKTIRLKFGGTTFLSRNVTTPSIGQGWTIEFEIIRTGATSQKCNATFSGGDGSASSYYATAGETLSGTVNLVLTGESGASASNDVVKETVKVGLQNSDKL